MASFYPAKSGACAQSGSPPPQPCSRRTAARSPIAARRIFRVRTQPNSRCCFRLEAAAALPRSGSQRVQIDRVPVVHPSAHVALGARRGPDGRFGGVAARCWRGVARLAWRCGAVFGCRPHRVGHQTAVASVVITNGALLLPPGSGCRYCFWLEGRSERAAKPVAVGPRIANLLELDAAAAIPRTNHKRDGAPRPRGGSQIGPECSGLRDGRSGCCASSARVLETGEMLSQACCTGDESVL